jgi:HEPN/RES N-terminal domain 1/RES domain
MGRMKDLLIQQEEQGWWFVRTHVCADCFTDEAIQQFVAGRMIETKCDYCGRSSDALIAAPMDDVLGLMANGLSVEWNDAVDELPYESAEGGYQGRAYDTWEFFDEVVGFPTEDAKLKKDIAHAFRDRLWCQRNYFSLSEQDALLIGWEEFCHEVKHERRYFFLDHPRALAAGPQDGQAPIGMRETPTPGEVLDEIADLVRDLSLVKPLALGHRFVRARSCHPATTFTTAADLGAAPVEKAVNTNRMSPSGIPMFYGSEQENTAVAETAEGPGTLSIGLFETLRGLRVLDLTNLPQTPSVFLADAFEQRIRITFLKRFVRDLQKPIARDGREHIEYVPTQVVTEYFRHVFEDEEGRRLDGILYRSAKTAGGVNCVLFCENENCCDNVPAGWQGERMWLRLKEAHQVTIK